MEARGHVGGEEGTAKASAQGTSGSFAELGIPCTTGFYISCSYSQWVSFPGCLTSYYSWCMKMHIWRHFFTQACRTQGSCEQHSTTVMTKVTNSKCPISQITYRNNYLKGILRPDKWTTKFSVQINLITPNTKKSNILEVNVKFKHDRIRDFFREI